ncbi:hypothetical protein [Nocardioides piscis]|uniref:Glycosyltransferase RgtA/B/C/D-like domain-containing protein n=1 Tax=Nocardioides piscis TaxID=2714938 RepID=A0A6G7YJI3_9ACTN|nr:hypothetical protein [Nocardioides piscis]QIK76899.1 hypothetical protein G7071_17125 [Nocardioides piscis]
MITTLVRRVLPIVSLAVLLGALVRNQSRPPLSGDGYFHLRMGRELLDGWSIADPGNLGPFDTADWVSTQWLAQLAMAGVEDLAGLAGVMWAAGFLVLCLALATFVCCRLVSAPLPAAFATILVCSAASPGLSARPQVFSYLFVLVVTVAWLRTMRDLEPRWWLVLVAWVWAPLHGMWPLAGVIGVVAIVGILLDGRADRDRILRLVLIPVLSSVIVLATPLGLRVYGSLFAVGSRAEYFAEWGPPDFGEPYAIALLGMFAIVLLVALKRRPLPWGEVLVIGMAAALAVSSARTTTVAAVMLAPLLAGALQQFVPRAPGIERREAAALALVLAACAVILVPVVQSRAEADVAPAWLDRRLDAQPAGTKVLNDWDTGAYFLWRHPQLALVMHGYGDVFTNDELRRNTDILRLNPGWDDEVRSLDADLALVDPDTSLGYALTNDPGWRVVEADDEFALLAPTTD